MSRTHAQIRCERVLKKKLYLLCLPNVMATPGDGTDPPGKDKQNEGGKGDQQEGTREPTIPLSDLRATVSQLLKEAMAAQGGKQQESGGSNSQPGKCQYRLSVDCVAEMTGLPLKRDPRNSYSLV